MSEPRILNLTLHKKAFEVMVTGEKTREFRKPSKWIESRLSKDGKLKHYDFVKFTNGYGSDKPYFVCKYNGYEYSYMFRTIKYSNGLEVEVELDDIMINLGEIVGKGNL